MKDLNEVLKREWWFKEGGERSWKKKKEDPRKAGIN
jgi:hypothetical protein